MKTRRFILTNIIIALIVLLINVLVSGWVVALANFKYYVVYAVGFSTVNYLYYYLIGKVLSWEKHPERTLITGILGSIPVNAGVYFVLNYLLKAVVNNVDYQQFIKNENLSEYIVVVMFSMIISLFIIIGYFFKAIRKERIRIDQLKAQNKQIQFDSLKAQLDPHFLFNNLNVLTALIGENPVKAENFTLSLSDIYKYVVAQKEQKTVLLQQEIAFAQKYLHLLKLRYENSLQFSLPEQFPKTAQIAPLSLQVLLENAVKHNRFSEDNPLKINVFIEGNYLVVKNNKNLNSDRKVLKTGLKNLAERIKLLNLPDLIVNESQASFEVKIPLFV